jgi:hypothetical protein
MKKATQQKVISLRAFKRKKAKAEQQSGHYATEKRCAAITFYTAIDMIKHSQEQDGEFFFQHGKNVNFGSLKFKLAMLSQQKPESVCIIEKVIDGLFPAAFDTE